MHAVSTNQIANILHFNGNIPKMLASGKSILTPAKSRRYVLLLLEQYIKKTKRDV